MSSPPKPWEVNPEGQSTATTGDGSAAPVTDGSAGVGTAAATGAGVASTLNRPATTTGGLAGSSYVNRTSMGGYGGMGSSMGSSMYGGGYGGMGGSMYGGMGGGMYGGMGGMYGGMGMGPGEQKGQMMMMLMNRLGEMVSGFAQMLQVAMNNVLVCVSNLAGLHQQYHTLPEDQPAAAGTAAGPANASGAQVRASDQQHRQPEPLTLYTFTKRLVLLYLLWRVASFLSVRLDRFLHPSSVPAIPPAAPAPHLHAA